MVRLMKSGNAIIFDFEENGHYLFEGEIEVPINSLTLVTDESNMATFRKSASNDIFISCTYDELEMSKQELESWFKTYACGSPGGGGGGGISSADVQTMIDQSVSGKADMVSAFTTAEYVSSSTTIEFKNAEGTVISSIDASSFVIDGMIDDVSIQTISGDSYLVIDFNTASGKEDIQIPLTDIFDASNYYTKDETDDAINAAIVSASGITSATVETMINSAVSGKADSSDVESLSGTLSAHTSNTDIHVTTAQTASWNAKSDFSGSYIDLTDKPTIPNVPTSNTAFTNDAGYITSGDVTNQIEEATSGKADTTAVTESINEAVSGKQDTLVSGVNIKTINNESLLGEGNITIQGGSGSGVTSGDVQTMIDSSISGKTDASAFTAYSAATDARLAEDEEVTAAALNDLNDALSGKADSSAVTANINAAISGKADTTAVTESIAAAVSGKQDTLIAGSGITISGNVISSVGGGGNDVIELTQAQYDALVSGGTVDPDAFYIITDAIAIDISNYYTSAQTQSAITDAISGKADTTAVTESINAAVSGKVDTSSVVTAVTSGSTDSEIPTAKAVYDAIPTGGTGGATYSAGTNISIDSANTISCTLNLINGTGTNSIKSISSSRAQGSDSFAIGSDGVKADGLASFAGGNYSEAKQPFSMAFGRYVQANNYGEASFGFYNKTNGGSNALGNNSGNTLFSVGNGSGITENARHNALEVRQNGDIYLNNGTSDIKLQDYLQIKVVKLTQQEYDALVQGGTVDNNTLYIIA